MKRFKGITSRDTADCLEPVKMTRWIYSCELEGPKLRLCQISEELLVNTQIRVNEQRRVSPGATIFLTSYHYHLLSFPPAMKHSAEVMRHRDDKGAEEGSGNTRQVK